VTGWDFYRLWDETKMRATEDGHLKSRFVEIGGQRLRVCEVKRGGDRPLLLYNGFGVSMEMLYDFMESLDRTDVLTFDIPGIGKSPSPLFPYRIPKMARLSARLLDYLGYREVDVMGISWGGGLAQQFARDFPDRCHRLILAATSAGAVMVPGKPTVALEMASPGAFNDPVRLSRFMSKIQGRGEPIKKTFIPKGFSEKNAYDARGHIYQIFAVWGWTSIHWLHRIQQPTLVLSGEGDPLVPPINGRILAWRIPNATLRTVCGGHLFLIVSREIVSKMIEEFLREEGEFA
jgi:poly(3-hydroxyalkanoate) depolymerase